MNKRTIRNKRGDLGGPIVTLLLAVAGIAIAGGVIAYMMGFVGNLQRPSIQADSVMLVNENKHWILVFNVDTTNSRSLTITSITIVDDDGNSVSIDLSDNPVVIKSGISKTEKIDLTEHLKSNQNLKIGGKATYKVILYTNVGVYRLTATLE